ncbi:MAG: hypothetical protein NT151_11245 [Acidobacteria bacterium]|nr:hypothetical protein [Acidobacteriota bacterium]
MTCARLVLATTMLYVAVPCAVTQPTPTGAIPMRISWSELNQDGYAQVTFVNDSPLMVTAWALNATVTRPDGTTVTHPSSKTDTIGMMASVRLGRNLPAVGPLLRPATPYTHPVRVDDPAKVLQFSLSVDAVVYEDGTVVGNRLAVAMLLAARETDATNTETWRAVIQSAIDAPDRDSAVGILKQAIEGGAPAQRMSFTLKGMAQSAVSQRANDKMFTATLAEALKTADVYVTECRRHLNPGQTR